jgi:GT2 family glycosyltransferase/tetratricopeptide (TPR) repeat protein/glycosyltransferase involved in cell wall biosynthesis
MKTEKSMLAAEPNITSFPKKKLKVGYLCNESLASACPYLRVVSPLAYLNKNKLIELVPVVSMAKGKLEVDEPALTSLDIVVVQRYFPAIFPFQKLKDAVKHAAAKIVYEIDDALFFVGPSHPDFKLIQAVWLAIENYIKNADLVTVSTQTLKSYLLQYNEKIMVYPNSIDPDLWRPHYKPKPDKNNVTILYSGGMTHQEDIELIEDALEKILQHYRGHVKIIFWGNSSQRLSKYSGYTHHSRFMSAYDKYARHLKELDIDFAVVPLIENPFNQAKSAIKWLEYSACQIPGIYSDLNGYCEVVKNGVNGILTKNKPDKWHEAIRHFIENPNLCQKIGQNAQRDVFERHTVEKNFSTLLEAYESLFQSNRIGKEEAEIYRLRADDKTSIVILTYNQLPVTKACIESIKKQTPEPHEIVFVDNNSTDGTRDYLEEIVQKNDNYRLIANEMNMGFAKGCNQGMQAATGNYIVLLNNDVVVTPHWLSGMIECLNSAADVGIVGPMTDNISGPQKVPGVDIDIESGLQEFSGDFRKRNRYRRIACRRIVGFCMLFKRDLIDRIGSLDENFGTGNFEDDDFCLTAAVAGFQNLICGDVFIHHKGSASFRGNKIDYSALMQGNKKVFFEKWKHRKLDPDTRKKVFLMNEFESADRLLKNGSAPKGIAHLVRTLKSAPKETSIVLRLARSLIECKRYDDGKEILNAVADLESKEKHYLLSRCLLGLGELQGATRELEAILEGEPEDADAIRTKGMVAYHSGDFNGAMALLEDALRRNPGAGEAYTYLGLMKWNQGDYQGGFEFLEKGFVLNPSSGDALEAYLAGVNQTGDFERAEVRLREAAGLCPQFKQLALFYISVLIKRSKYAAAIDEIKKAIVAFGLDDALLAAGKEIRSQIGPLKITKRGPNHPTISICMIVKNEETNLAKALASLEPVANEIIVVDTCSTDRTKDIAAVFGANVFDFQWTDDFSEARNFSLSKATGDWILVIDADEVIAPADYSLLRKTVKKSKKNRAFLMVTRNYTTAAGNRGWRENDGRYASVEAGLGWIPSPKVRLFPNRRGIRFSNPVHELVEFSLQKLGIKIFTSEVAIHHYGKLDREKVVEKGWKYFDLGIKKLESHTNDYRALKELAVQASELGEHEESIRLWKEVLAIRPNDPVALMSIGSAHLMLKDYRKASEFSKKALEINPDLREAALNYSVAEMIVGDVGSAKKTLQWLSEKEPAYPPGNARLAMILLIEGRGEESIKYFEKIMDKGISCMHAIEKQAAELIDAEQVSKARRALVTAKKINLWSHNLEMLYEKTLSGEWEGAAYRESSGGAPSPCSSGV